MLEMGFYWSQLDSRRLGVQILVNCCLNTSPPGQRTT